MEFSHNPDMPACCNINQLFENSPFLGGPHLAFWSSNSLSTDFVIALIPVTRNALDAGGGQPIPAGLSYPPLKTLEQ